MQSTISVHPTTPFRPLPRASFAAPVPALAADPLERLGAAIALKRGETLFDAGDAADHYYKVVSGTVRLVRLLADGRRQIADFFFPGELFGFESRAQRSSGAEAVGDCTLVRYPRRAVEAQLGTDPRLARQLVTALCGDLAHAHEQALLLGRKTAEERIASFLLELARRNRVAGATVVPLPMSRSDIADHLGLTTETVSRVVTRLKTAGVIRLLSGNRVQLVDRGRLAAMTEGEYALAHRTEAA